MLARYNDMVYYALRIISKLETAYQIIFHLMAKKLTKLELDDDEIDPCEMKVIKKKTCLVCEKVFSR